MPDLDTSQQLVDAVRSARARGVQLRIRGGKSKAFLSHAADGEELDTRAHRGIIDFDPQRMRVKVRAGTPLNELRATLDIAGWMLAFEPPGFSSTATVGGMLACGLAGPRRPWSGTVGDHLLGAVLIDGRGERQEVGAHMDTAHRHDKVTDLLAGSLGRLGVIIEATLRVVQKPCAELTLRLQSSQGVVSRQLAEWACYRMPISGLCHTGDALYIRLEGSKVQVNRGLSLIGGDPVHAGLWTELREHRLSFFRDPRPLWRLTVSSDAPRGKIPGDLLLDWGGAQGWLKSAEPSVTIRRLAESLGGYAVCFTPDANEPSLKDAPPANSPLLQELKQSLDPYLLFGA